MKKEMIESYPELLLTVIYSYSEHWTDFRAYEIIYTEDTGKHFYEIKGSTGSGDETSDIKEAQTYIKGVVKWDGCCHYYFGDEDGYIHLCGGGNIKNLMEVVKKIYNRSGELMSSRDKIEFPI